MQQSDDQCSVVRSRDPKPVEGDSEIDIVVSTSRHLIFVEAKLGSDISMRTTYDPCRDQITRNIDCLLESAAGREPQFWMFVRDLGCGRMYCQLVDEYRKHPEMLIAELPHRDPEVLKKVAQNIALLQWKDLGRSLLNITDADSAEARRVKEELRLRVGA